MEKLPEPLHFFDLPLFFKLLRHAYKVHYEPEHDGSIYPLYCALDDIKSGRADALAKWVDTFSARIDLPEEYYSVLVGTDFAEDLKTVLDELNHQYAKPQES